MDVNTENINKLVEQIEDYTLNEDYSSVCFEVGRFIENIASDIYFKKHNIYPKNAKESIEFLIRDKIIHRILGYRLHVIRELRNSAAHPDESYEISQKDARDSVETFNEIIKWLDQDKLAWEWNQIIEEFEIGAEPLSTQHLNTGEILRCVNLIESALRKAIDLKMKTLKIKKESSKSTIEIFALHGIDLRSPEWVKFTRNRSIIMHGGIEYYNRSFTQEELQKLLPELKHILNLLNPLDKKDTNINCPQITIIP